MFIYEKNKINSETGKTEQTLNITFEGNKPVENPDVIVTKDGITGIKSDSNAYVENTTKFFAGIGNPYDINTGNYNINNIDCSYSLVNRYYTSLSINGEIVMTSENNSKSIVVTNKCKYVGINITGTTENNKIEIIGLLANYPQSICTIDADLTNGGELIINMENGEVTFGSTTTTISDYNTYLNNGSTIYITYYNASV